MRKITYLLLNITFILAIICTVAMPFLSKIINSYYNYSGFNLTLFIATVTVSGIFATVLLYNLKTVYKTFAKDNPFVIKNVKYLNAIALSCGGITLCYIIKAFFLFTPATLMVVLVFGLSILLAISLRDLFKKAVEYKEENELTI